MSLVKKVIYIFLIISHAVYAHPNLSEADSGDVIGVLNREFLPASHGYKLSLTKDQQYWLRERKKLILAVSLPDNPPMDITSRANLYEGVTADVVGLLQEIIGTDIEVKVFKTRAAAIDAVKTGIADFIGSSNNYEKGEGLLLTNNYLSATPVLYKNFSVKTNEIKKIAVSKYYLPYAEVKNAFPNTSVDVYPSRYSAVAAVAYGKADAVLIDKVSGNFLINKYHQDNIQLVGAASVNTKGFSFGVNKNRIVLKEILDSAISIIPNINIDAILKRWNGGGLSIQPEFTQLTTKELQWLTMKKRIKIALNKNLPPLSFIDVNGNVHGIASDLIEVIGSRLNISFDVIPVSSTLEQISALNDKNVDLIILTPNKERRETYIFSHAFSLEPLVYVVNSKNADVDPTILMNSGRPAMVAGFITSIETEKLTNDSINIRSFDKVEGALDCISDDFCDIVILPSRVAKYFIDTYYKDSLYISGELYGSVPISANFAALPAQEILVEIISKVIDSIPPGELESLSTRWRVSGKKELITWQDILHEFKQEVLLVVLFVLASVIWSFSMYRQIVRRNRAESALRVQLKFVEELVDSTPNPIYAIDKLGMLVLCNKSFSSFVKINKDSLDRTSVDRIAEKVPFMSPLFKAFYETLRTQSATDGDYRLTCDGTVVDIYHWQQVYRDLEGEVQGVVGGWIDVSERTSLMHDLANASRDAKEASRAKSTFLATMSHEIRTPMNAIIGLLELTLRKGDLTTTDHDSINIAYSSSRDLLSLIGDILDISKIESGKLELAPAPHSVGELSRSVINVFSAIARQDGLRLELICERDAILMIDAVRYKQILSNLVSNAIKFTRKGGIDILLEFSQDAEWCEVTLKVKDSGIGISKSDLASLFQPFSQASQPADIQKSGSGLGLMISRTLCQMMGGDLNINSSLNEGTTVVVTLRLPRVDSHAPLIHLEKNKVLPRQDVIEQSVLIVDDHPTNRLLVSQQLEFLGYEVVSSESGREALQTLSTRSFDIIITDFNMPDVDGLEFTSFYRQQEVKESRDRAVIIGLTADARQEQIKKAIEAGMDDCLFKPVSLDELKACLATHDINQITVLPDVMASRFVNTLKNLTTGNSQLINALLTEFINASEEDIKILNQACQTADSQAFITQLHRLKGGARIIGAEELVACCSDWETSTRLPWCMPSALRQVEKIYLQVKDSVFYWKKINSEDIEGSN
ncbi:UNVERIFIED_CONTAM: transporter substrate-binding domain-containing protein [Aeromonas hydrophila]